MTTTSEHANHGIIWQNWSGGQVARPAELFTPGTEAELAERLKRTQGEVRVVGAGHSFSPVVVTDRTLVSLDRLSGIIHHDPALVRARVWAGTRLFNLGDLLHELNQGLVNQGDVDRQSLAGVVSTGTHGTGITLGCLSAAVSGLTLVCADGAILHCSATENPELFAAARVSLGAFGVLTQIELQNRPAYRLSERVEVMSLGEVLRNIETWRDRHRHVEFFPFPHGDSALVKWLDETAAEPTDPKKPLLDDDVLLHLACAIQMRFPALATPIQRLAPRFVSAQRRVDRSYRIFPSPRSVRFNEMEYQVPAARGLECLEEVLSVVRKLPRPLIVPIEFRYVAGDDIWLSPFEGGARASISIHQYHEVDYRPEFNAIEPVFWRYGGRPHWGKLHTLGSRELAPLYPRWDDFHHLRRTLDPRGRFLNAHLRQIFGENA